MSAPLAQMSQPVTPSSSQVSPAMRICRHALESILGMLDLCGLGQALAVSREWSAAVRSMAPICASFERDEWRSEREGNVVYPLHLIDRILGSPLLRHLAAIHIRHPDPHMIVPWALINNASLALLAQHAPNLTSLSCALTLTPEEPLILPPTLTSLTLQLGSSYTGETINSVLTTVAALPSLCRLRLALASLDRWGFAEYFPFDETPIEFDLLSACPSLTHLELTTFDGRPPDLTEPQLEQIRLLGHLRQVDIGYLTPNALACFLKTPINARWQHIGRVRGDAHTGELLLRLPSLSKLDISYAKDTVTQIDFLPQLPQLTMLNQHCTTVPADAVLTSLLLCDGLTDLSLECGFDSSHWCSLLSHLPKLRRLQLRHADKLTTLECFAAGPITQSLEELVMEYVRLPPAEVSHLYKLRRLRTLRLENCFSPPLADATIASFSPPTALLPALTEFFCRERPLASVARHD